MAVSLQRDTTKEETREAILDAAERLLARYGYGKMTMSDLAEEAGIGVGTTYLYFPGKAEVALAVVNRANKRIVEQLQAVALSLEAPPARLNRMLQMRVLLRYEAARTRKDQMEDFRTAIHQQMSVHQIRFHWFEMEVGIFAAVLQKGRVEGDFEFDGETATAQTLLWAMDSLMPRNLKARDYEQPEAFRDKTERIAALLLRALRPAHKSSHETQIEETGY